MRKLRLLGLVIGFIAVLSALPAAELGQADRPVRIGMIGSLFRDVPDALAETMCKPLGTLMTAQTGMTGELLKAGDAHHLGRQLAERQLHLGIFHGFEYAWARQEYPQLRPLVIAVNQKKHLRAYLVVRADSGIRDFGGLRDKTLDLPRGTKGHCHLFVEGRCRECGQCAPQALLSRVSSAANVEDALDEVVDGNVTATVVEGVALECYQRRKPGRFTQLKVAVESELFPAGVVVYCPGTLDEKVVARFRDGLLNTHKTILGRQLLTLWKLTGFEAVPADYERTLADIVKAYPAPTE